MKALKALWLAWVVVLASCAGLSEELPLSPENAQAVINQALKLNIAIQREANAEYAAQLLTSDEHKAVTAQVRENLENLKHAQKALDSGNWADAQTRAELIRKAGLKLQQIIHERARAAR